MGRLYSGNLAAFKSACDRLRNLDFLVITEEFFDSTRRQCCLNIRIEFLDGDILYQKTFCHVDEDVLYNTCTSWLNLLAEQLQEWNSVNSTH